MSPAESGPVLIAYDGSDLSKLAIDEAAAQLRPGREAIVLTVWQTFNVGFAPAADVHIDAASSTEVRRAAEETAAEGASRATAAGFQARSRAAENSAAWKCIVQVAEDEDAGLIVLGSHGRSGFPDLLLGSVAQSVAAHSRRSVLIVHRQDGSAELKGGSSPRTSR